MNPGCSNKGLFNGSNYLNFLPCFQRFTFVNDTPS